MPWVSGAEAVAFAEDMGLTEVENPKEELTYNSRINGNQWQGEVVDSEGRTIIVSSLVLGDTHMTVTDLRDGSVRKLRISLCNSIEEVEADMREEGYLTDEQTLVTGISERIA